MGELNEEYKVMIAAALFVLSGRLDPAGTDSPDYFKKNIMMAARSRTGSGDSLRHCVRERAQRAGRSGCQLG